MIFGDRDRNTISLSPNEEGWEIRINNPRGEYWTATISTAEMIRACALVDDGERARKLGRETWREQKIALAEEITAELFRNGNGETADRLVLVKEGRGKGDLGGMNRHSVAAIIQAGLK